MQREGRVTVTDWKENIRDTTPRKTHTRGETCGKQRHTAGGSNPGWHVKLRLKRLPQPFRRCRGQPHAGRVKEDKELEMTYWVKLPAGLEIRSKSGSFQV